MIQRAALKIQQEVAYDEININVQRDGILTNLLGDG